MSANGITAIVVTLNEEANIANCLSTLQWCDELILVDMKSDDRTVEIAHEKGAIVFEYPRVGFCEPAKVFAEEKASHDWVLFLDADEMIPKTLAEELRSIANSNQVDVVKLPRKNYIFGKWMQATSRGIDQENMPRFYKRGFVDLNSTIHQGTTISPGARIKNLVGQEKFAIVHFNFLDSQSWFSKMNRYTTIEAEQAFARGERWNLSLFKLLYSVLRIFYYRYLRCHGYKDGLHGLILSFYVSIYVGVAKIKLWELSSGFDTENNLKRYSAVASAVLTDYEK